MGWHCPVCGEGYPEKPQYIDAAIKELQECSDNAKLDPLRELYSEVDCRIEHGAESGGHLEYVRTKLREIIEP